METTSGVRASFGEYSRELVQGVLPPEVLERWVKPLPLMSRIAILVKHGAYDLTLARALEDAWIAWRSQ